MTDNAQRLEAVIMISLTPDAIPTDADIEGLAKGLRGSHPLYTVTDEEYEELLKRIKAALRVEVGPSSRVIEDYRPWVASRKADITPFYWDRYRLYLLQNGLGPKSVSALDQVAEEILDLVGNPASFNGWPRRGLVMGDVQSGKTSNYTGLVCKAADAGYRLIIILTGTLEMLRRQTQGRLDAGFVGLDSAGILTRSQSRREIGVGRIARARSAGVFTSTLSDFRTNMVNQLGFRLQSMHEPVILVVKKNRQILDNLTAWLLNYNSNDGGTIDEPMLLIDDEADSASVNTSREKASAINAAIRKLLVVFPRSTYIGYTATPFANIFINPDSTDEMLGDDLFPRHFVFGLESPSNYLGALSIFGEEASGQCLREIDDADDWLPRGHRSSQTVASLPESLTKALRTFVLVNVILDLRPLSLKHRSMLVNVSQFTAVQEQVKEEVKDLLYRIQLDLRNYSGLPEREAERFDTIAELHRLWEEEYADCGEDWTSILASLNRAAQPISVRAVNQRTGAASLDYSQYRDDGLRVIAIGGNSLSRGLTLEGLCVSYFYRNTQMYDTLLQMGRWFGFRDGYADLFRIWMGEEAIGWYGHIAEAAEELRNEIKWMQKSRLKPIDFGLKVRAHPESLLITARNKMRHSYEITKILSVSNRLVETPRLYADEGHLEANHRATLRFLERLRLSEASWVEGKTNPFWTQVDPSLVAEFLESFVAYPLNLSFQPHDLAIFIRAATDPKMRTWDVVIPGGEGGISESGTEIKVHRQRRKLKHAKETKSILVSSKNMRVGSRGVEKEGLTAALQQDAEACFFADPANQGKKSIPDHAYRQVRERPLLMVHFLEDSESLLDIIEPRKRGLPLCALGLSFPRLSAESETLTYRVNLVEFRNMLEADEPEDDELEDEGDQAG